MERIAQYAMAALFYSIAAFSLFALISLVAYESGLISLPDTALIKRLRPF